MENLLDTAAAAARLGLAPDTMTTMRCRGRGPAWVKIGRRALYRPEDLAAYAAAHVRATSDAPRPERAA